MKKSIKTAFAAAAIAVMPTTMVVAQDEVEASVGTDLVSGYVWRGQDLGGISVQPSASVSYKGFTLGAWGNVGLESSDTKEFDLTLSYSTGGLTLGVTDYWFTQKDAPAKYFTYGSPRSTAHVFEANLGYDFGPLAVNWYTNFAGAQGCKSNGDYAYASYFSIAAPFKLGGLDWTAEIGATPWESDFYNGGANGFEVCDISLGATKEIKVTDSFSVPAFAKVTVNPKTEGAYFVFGLSF